MIYFKFSSYACEYRGYPEFASQTGPIRAVDFRDKAIADEIFTFEGWKTVYWKNRQTKMPLGYQYTNEEQTLIALKAVPLKNRR